ncbi:hypothetical protein AVEN_263611-1 [Araneus ventricosus]|uniref:Uncharacterized protein n=1 Tax=Araneus ventricosus TaxID=182803 RepID=A0A4Y2TLX7_ARAVE|nr:hypothetical protein AVEN_263611-1 [Araneus ventricosus]
MHLELFPLDNCLQLFNPLRTTVTRACQLLGTFPSDCHKYVPALVSFSYRLSRRRGVTPVLVQLGLTRKSAPALRSHARWETSVCQIVPHVFRAVVLEELKSRPHTKFC